MASDARRDAVEILRLHNALMDIAEMPVYDQDDAVRVRDVARRALGLGLAPEAER